MESGSFEETTPAEMASSVQPCVWTSCNDASRTLFLASSIDCRVEVFPVEVDNDLATGKDQSKLNIVAACLRDPARQPSWLYQTKRAASANE